MKAKELVHKDVLDLFEGVSYKYDSCPLIDSLSKIFTEGINCELFVHIILELFFLSSLPKWLRAKEMYEDDNFVKDVTDGFYQAGDVFFFSPRENINPMYFHLAIMVGQNEEGVPMLAHASNYMNGSNDAVRIWPLNYFLQQKKYKFLQAVKRVRINPKYSSIAEEEQYNAHCYASC